jgi:uncharacterized protein YcbK (DUF882 family)
MTNLDRVLLQRRLLLKGLVALPLALSTTRLAYANVAANNAPRELSLFHTHTDERLKLVYFDGKEYVPEALSQLNYFMRDFRTGDMPQMDPGVFDILSGLCSACGNGTFDIISAYRSKRTNEMLRAHAGRSVAKHSLHLEGKALDIRLNGRATKQLRNAALALAGGGVGYYPKSNFLHVDTGRVRIWGATG